MAKTYAYVRASTNKQDKSCEMQEADLKTHCERVGEEWGGCFTDDATSGMKAFSSRPAARKLMDVVQPGDRLLVWKLDRLGRRTIDMLQTLDHFSGIGVAVCILDWGGGTALDMQGAMAQFMITLFAGFAQFERGLISERTKGGLRHRKDNGLKYHGQVRYGYKRVFGPTTGKEGRPWRVVKEWVRDQAECDLIAEMWNRVQRGERIKDIWEEWQGRGVKTAEGKKWQLWRMYKAYWRYDGLRREGKEI